MSLTGQSINAPHFTVVDGQPGCEHGVSMDEYCDDCAQEISDYDTLLDSEQRASDERSLNEQQADEDRARDEAENGVPSWG